MFTNIVVDESKVLVNPIQYAVGRLAVYAINKNEDQVIGFEFVNQVQQSNPQCCGSTIVNLCVPIEIINNIDVISAQFAATNDPCYNDWIINKTLSPDIELQKDIHNNIIGILVRFFKDESSCYPVNMAFKLWGFNQDNCKYLLSSGLLIFR